MNKKGNASILGVLVAGAIGLVVVGGVTKSIVHQTEQAKQITNQLGLNDVKNRVTSYLQYQKAWEATKDKADALEAGCYPGAEDGGGSKCPIKFYYNPANPEDYANGLQQWIYAHGTESKGVGLVDKNGTIILDEEAKGCIEAGTPLGSCDGAPSKYIEVEVTPPETAPGNYDVLPTFTVKLKDSFYTKTTKTFVVSGSSDPFALIEQMKSQIEDLQTQIDEGGSSSSGAMQATDYLFGNIHKESECVSSSTTQTVSGNTLVTTINAALDTTSVPGAKLCRFSKTITVNGATSPLFSGYWATGCPDVWARYRSWSRTTPGTTTGTAVSGTVTCTTGSHSTLSDTSIETNSINYNTCTCLPSQIFCNCFATLTCTANVVEALCY